MKILVTGANGLLGQKLVALLSSKDEVTLIATGRGSNRNPPGSYSYLSCDLTSEEAVRNLIQKALPDCVIHCAAMTQVDDCQLDQVTCTAVNVSATSYLINACELIGAYMLYVSTDFVFDGSNGPLTEEDKPNPISFYGESKLKAEKLVQASSLKWAIARTVLVYGVAHDMSRSNIVLWVKKSLEQGKPIKVVNDQWRTPTLVEDLALGCWLVVKDRHEGIFHISGEGMVSPFDIAMKTAGFFGLDKSLITPVDASTFTQPGKRPPKTGFKIDKAKSILGFKPKSFEEGLAVLKGQLNAGAC